LIQSIPILHSEVPVFLQNDVALDAERPEYHRVRLQPAWTSSTTPGSEKSSAVVFHAHSTGIQQSSRLASLLNAEALVLLPQATAEKRKIEAGTAFWALLLRDNPLFPRVRLGESRHMAQLVSRGRKSRSQSHDHGSSPTSASGAGSRRQIVVEVILLRCTRTPNVTDASLSNDGTPVDDNFQELCRQVSLTLSRPGTTPVKIAPSSRTHTYANETTAPETVWNKFILGSPAQTTASLTSSGTSEVPCDIQIVVYEGPLLAQLQLASYLKSTALSKLAPALAMDARHGIASRFSSTACLFEVVVGVSASSLPRPCPQPAATASSNVKPSPQADGSPAFDDAPREDHYRLVLLLPMVGLTGALESVRRQIRHGVRVAQGFH
jgi:hypothetical protein